MQRLEVSGAVRSIYGSLGVKRLFCFRYFCCITHGNKIFKIKYKVYFTLREAKPTSEYENT